jgi:hypothetical protein
MRLHSPTGASLEREAARSSASAPRRLYWRGAPAAWLGALLAAGPPAARAGLLLLTWRMLEPELAPDCPLSEGPCSCPRARELTSLPHALEVQLASWLDLHRAKMICSMRLRPPTT